MSLRRTVAAWLLGLALSLPGAAVAQLGLPVTSLPDSEKGPIARPPENVQALVGQWGSKRSVNVGTPAFTAEIRAHYPEVARKIESGILPPYQRKCAAFGVPGMMSLGFRLAANARAITIVAAEGLGIRLIALDKKTHTDDAVLFENWGGEGIAHWDGDTLVVDTKGLKRENQIAYQVELGDEQAHVVERFRLDGPNQLEITTTLESPKSLAKPWTYRTVFARQAPSSDVPFCAPAPRT